jgi:drug/metabolite transporter (DMT)-like permease
VAAFYVGAIYCLYLAIRYISLVDAMLLLNTGPFFAPVINRLWFKKHESRAVWLGISLGFVGVVFVLRPGAGIIRVGALIGLMSGLCLAVRMVLTSFLAQTESKQVITFYSLGAGLLLCLAILALTGVHVANWEQHLFPPRDWLRPMTIFPAVGLAMVALGILALLQPWFVAAGYEHASVGQVGPFRFSGVIFAGLLDWFLWGQIPDLYSIMGFLIITTSGVWVIRQGGRK